MVCGGIGYIMAGLEIGLLIASIFLPFLPLLHSLTVCVNQDVIRLRFGIGLIRKRFHTKEIQTAFTVRNRWYNGFGIRKIWGGWLYNVSGWDAVEIQLWNGRRNRIGTDEPEALLAAIESVIGNTQIMTEKTK